MRALLFLLAASLTFAADPPAAPTTPAKAAPVLQFRVVEKAAGADTEEMVLVDRKNNNPNEWVTKHVKKKVEMDESMVKTAFVVAEPDGRETISLEFTDAGSKRFAEVTSECKGKQLAIVFDGALYSAPNIMEEIRGGQCRISGSFNRGEAKELAGKIAAAAKKQKP